MSTRTNNRRPAMSVATFKAAVTAGTYRQIAASLEGRAKGFAPPPKRPRRAKAAKIPRAEAEGDKRRMAKLLREADAREAQATKVSLWKKALRENGPAREANYAQSESLLTRKQAVSAWKKSLKG